MGIRLTRNSLRFLILALLAHSAAAAWAVAAPAPPDPLYLLGEALSAPDRPYHGHLTVTEWSGRQTHAEEVEVYYSPTNRYRWEFLAPDGSASRVAVSDGAHETILLVRPGKTVTGDAVRSSTKLMMPGREKELLLRNYQVFRTGPDMVAGRKAWVLDLRPLVTGKPHQQLWIDTESHIILSIKRYLPKKRFAALSRFTRFDLKTPLPDSLFSLQVDSAAPVTQDLTPDFLSIDELEKATGREIELPVDLPGGFVFESADYFDVGKDVVRHLRFTDGLALLSVFLTDKPVRLPPGGAIQLNAEISPPGSLRLSSTGKVFSFHRGRQYYTLMSDVSRELLEHIAAKVAPPKRPARTGKAAPAIEAPPPPMPEGRIRWTKMAGSVDSVDQAGERIWAKAKTGRSRDFKVTGATKILRDKKPAKLADIKPGDKVELLRYNSATREVKRIELSAASSR
jgi:outer membrane lipoprotein-sorting protein